MRASILIIISVICMFASPVLWAEENCFRHHLQDAIVINEARRPLYSALTDGKSENISDRLIFFESVGLLPAANFDMRAASFQSVGIPILCDEFVSMDKVPGFSGQEPLPTQKFE